MRVFTNSTREVCLVVLTIDDITVEDLEDFTVSLSSGDPSVVIGRSNSTGRIIDNDSKFINPLTTEGQIKLLVDSGSSTFN